MLAMLWNLQVEYLLFRDELAAANFGILPAPVL